MLKCMFGRCSSDTYIVNRSSKIQSHKRDVRNGSQKIVSLPPDPIPPNDKSQDVDTKKLSSSSANNVLQQNENVKYNGIIVSKEVQPIVQLSETPVSNENKENDKFVPQEVSTESSVKKEVNHNNINVSTISSKTEVHPQNSEQGLPKETIVIEHTNVVRQTNVAKQTNVSQSVNLNEKPNVVKEINAEIKEKVSESQEVDENSSESDEESEIDRKEAEKDSTIESTSMKKKNKGKRVRIEIGEIEKEPVQVEKEKERDTEDIDTKPVKRRSGIIPLPVKYDEATKATLPNYPKDPADEELIKKAIESNDFLNKIISGKRLEDVIRCMYNKEISAKETIIKQGEKGSHMYVSAKGKYQVLVKGKVVSTFDDVRVFGELAILYNAKRLASIKAVTSGRVWVLDRIVYQQIMVQYNIQEQDEIMEFLMNNQKLNVVGKDALQEVANLLKSEFFSAGKQIVRQGDKGYKFYIIRAGTVTITKDGEGVVGNCKKGDCFGELALLKEDSRQATVTADAPGVECLTLTRKEFIDHFGELKDLTDIKARPQDSIKDVVVEHEDINLMDLKIIKTLGVGGFGRVELVQHIKKKDLVFALKYLKKIDIVLQHQQEHVYNEKNIQMASNSPFIVRLYRTYKDNKYIYLLMESCLGGDLWSLLQKQRLRRFEEKEARFIAACVLEAFEYLHSRGIIYRDLKPENLLIAGNGYIKLTDFGFAKKISSRGRTFTFAGTPEYVAPEIVLNKGHDRAVDYWAFGAFIFEMLTGRTPFRTDDSSHMKTYNKILNGIDNVQFPNYVNLKARHIIEKLCRPVPSERLGMQRGGIKDIKAHKWFLGFDWQKFAKCEIPSPFKPKLKSPIDTQNFDPFKMDTDIPPDELSGWDVEF